VTWWERAAAIVVGLVLAALPFVHARAGSGAHHHQHVRTAAVR